MAPASIFAISPDGSRIAYIAQGHLFVHTLATAGDRRPRHRARADGGPAVVARRAAARVSVPNQIFASCRRKADRHSRSAGSRAAGGMTKGWWHDDGTIYFAVWRESLYRVPASGRRAGARRGHRTRHGNRFPFRRRAARRPADRHDACCAGRTRRAWISSTAASALPSPTISTSTSSSSARPTSCCSCDCAGIPACGSCRSMAAGSISTRATSLEAGARDFSVSGEGTLVSSVPARERRELVWVEHGSAPSGPGKTPSTRSIATMPGAPFEAGPLSLRALARWPARGVCHSRRRRRRGVRRARSGDGPRHARAGAQGLDGRRRPADGSRGRRRAGCCTRPEASRRCRSTTGPRMDRRVAGRSWPARPRR